MREYWKWSNRQQQPIQLQVLRESERMVWLTEEHSNRPRRVMQSKYPLASRHEVLVRHHNWLKQRAADAQADVLEANNALVTFTRSYPEVTRENV